MISSAPPAAGEAGPATVGPGPRSFRVEDVAESGIRTREIGRSEEGRPIEIALRGPEPGALRILVLAGQHGDEPWGRIAVRRWIARVDDRPAVTAGSPPIACLAVLDANPDGSRRGRRWNAHDVDLNRDHLLLEAPETRAIHETVRRYSPHLIVDVHNFPSRRRHLLAQGWTIGADVQIAGATHPAIRTSVTAVEEEGFVLRIQNDLAARGFTAVPYTLFRRSGRARPSTLRVRDARNSLSLRYGAPTFLLEGRDPGRKGSVQDGLRTAEAQLEALRSIEAWASEHRERLLRGPPIPEAGESVPVEARWVEDGEPRSVPFERVGTGEVVRVPWARFAGALRARRRVSLPRAYAVRNDLREVHAVLARHGIVGDQIGGPRSVLVEPVRSWEAATAPIARASEAPRPSEPFPLDLIGYTSYSVHQRAGRALAVWLEAGPRSGLAALRTERAPARGDGRPPVLRIVVWDYPPTNGGSTRTGRTHLPGPLPVEPLSVASRWAFGTPTMGSGDRGEFGSPIPAAGRETTERACRSKTDRPTDPVG